MNVRRIALLCLVLLTAACGRKETIAEKSATAFREAQAKGITAGGDGHDHGHQAAAPSPSTTTDHAAHDGSTAMDHAAHDMDQAAPGAASQRMDHAQHRAAPSIAHAGHEMPARDVAHDQHAGMQHGTTPRAADPHAQHRQPTTPAQADPHAGHTMTTTPAALPATTIPTGAPRTNAEMQRVQPASTLRSDAFDAPAPVSVSEAAKGKQGGAHQGHSQHH